MNIDWMTLVQQLDAGSRLASSLVALCLGAWWVSAIWSPTSYKHLRDVPVEGLGSWLQYLENIGDRARRLLSGALATLTLLLIGWLWSSNQTSLPKLQSHLFYSSESNYASMFFRSEMADVLEIEDQLTIRNSSEGVLTHISVEPYVFVDITKPRNFFSYYELDQNQYLRLPQMTIGALASGEEHTIKLAEVIESLARVAGMSHAELNQYMFPPFEEDYRTSWSVSNPLPSRQLFWPEEMNDLFIPSIGDTANSLGGLALKLVVTYTLDGQIYSNILLGGAFHFAVENIGVRRLCPQSVVGFIKPLYSVSYAAPIGKKRLRRIHTEIPVVSEEVDGALGFAFFYKYPNGDTEPGLSVTFYEGHPGTKSCPTSNQSSG